MAINTVGIGTTSPAWTLTVAGGITNTLLTTTDYIAGTTGSGLAIGMGTATGTTYGFIQGVTAGGSADNGNIILNASGGKVGIGTTSPSEVLDVNGGIRAGASTVVTEACGSGAANHEGTQRYNFTTHSMEYCNGTSWTAVGGGGGAAAAWVAFDSSGNILSSYNVTSVTHNSTGHWTVNFTSALADANYAAFVCGVGTGNSEGLNGDVDGSFGTGYKSTTAVHIATWNASSSGYLDWPQAYVVVYR